MSADTRPGGGATEQDAAQDYEFGDGIRALARSDPDRLAELAIENFSGHGADVVLSAIAAAGAESAG